jgi:hypothetical protein
MSAALARAQAALQARNYREALTQLRVASSAAASEPAAAAQAFHVLGALHHGAAPDAALPLDEAASAAAYAGCVTALLSLASLRATLTHALFFDAVHACKSALAYEEVPPGSDAFLAVNAALKRTVASCEHAATDNPDATKALDATVISCFGIGVGAFAARDRQRAARYYRRLLTVVERAAAHGVRCGDPRACECAPTAALNLAVLEASMLQEHAAANAAVRADSSQCSVATTLAAVTDDGAEPQMVSSVQRPACAACGAKPLAPLRACGGTCGGAARYCGADCYAGHVRQHMRDSGCKKRKPAVAAAGGDAASARTE